MNTDAKSAGFTLIELTVAVAIFLVFITATFGTFTTVHDFMARTEAHEDLYQTGRVVLAQLSAELASAYQPAGSTETELVGEDTDGHVDSIQSDRISFLTTAHPLDEEGTYGDVTRVTYSLDGASSSDEPSGLYLEESWTPGLELNEDQVERHLVSPLVVGFNCKYLPVEADWELEWVEQTTPPLAVRVELTLQDLEAQSLPLVLVSTTNLAMTTIPAGAENDALQ